MVQPHTIDQDWFLSPVDRGKTAMRELACSLGVAYAECDTQVVAGLVRRTGSQSRALLTALSETITTFVDLGVDLDQTDKTWVPIRQLIERATPRRWREETLALLSQYRRAPHDPGLAAMLELVGEANPRPLVHLNAATLGSLALRARDGVERLKVTASELGVMAASSSGSVAHRC
ncbi:hypothetical protein [Nocardia sp. NRRL S-836]|uniref:hypothetical protein n=1 Tax=Nocardia sp. NRRL S-836 TaxID=1519492 RepID=UPI0006AE5CEF|nr:hypothetical protein [Nocardia sp. NRRL S-836]KOV84702.1 hypothetical protein ADL03_15635 [Nocardia sp. NRRL S-836]